ncbi:condensation domain protein [Mycobacterium xenopi 4042]|uniref:Condensation domain protein n=1 Tax=Mycobacterium xenopi 4042 TaxID=1299334 RepID=X8E6H4_MYCXE|nr:condensation domain protein [Mycobacterium xenopi 4042]
MVVSAEWADIGWQVVDVAGWPPGRLQESIEQAAHHSFDLAAEIPLRAGLFRLADDEHVLVVVVHHIAADGWSITPLVRDLGLAYGARCAGRVPDWDPLPVQYADYTLWQRAQFGDLDDSQSLIAAQLAYWEQVLAGCPSGWCCPPIGRIRRWPVSGVVGWPWSGRRGCSSRWRGWRVSITRPVSWWCRLRWRCCWASLPRVRMWLLGFRSLGGGIRRWMSWSGFRQYVGAAGGFGR